MKTLGRNKSFRLLAGVVAAAALGGAIQTWAAEPLIITNSNKAARSAPANIYYSAGLSDVIKMVDAKVDAEVVKAYIKNSAVPYNPSAGEVIYLKNKGVPPDIITAMLQRGAELRAQAAQGAQYAQAAQYPGNASMSSMPTYPPYGYGADYGLYPADYGYGYPYAYGGYPGYWWYNSFWPFFGFDDFDHHHHGDFRHGDFRHVNQFNRFNNFRHNQFQAFSSSPFNNARFQNFDFNRFNRSFAFNTPRVGISQLGVPSRAFGPGAFAGGSANAAFIGARGGSAGMVRAPGIVGVRSGGFAAVRGGGGGHGGGGGGGHR